MTVHENLKGWITDAGERDFESLISLILFEIEGVYGSRLSKAQIKELLKLGREKRDELKAAMKPIKETKQKSLF